MVFESPSFLYLLLPAMLVISLLPRLGKNKLLLIALSIFLYRFFGGGVLFPLAAIVLVAFLGGWLMSYCNLSFRRIILASCIVIVLIILMSDKYLVFLLSALNALTRFWGSKTTVWVGLTPKSSLGISYLTFTAIAYLFDCYRGKINQARLIDCGLYLTFFPKIVAGPIARFTDMLQGKVNLSLSNAVQGLQRIIYGLGKKMVIANTMAVVADSIFGRPADSLTFATAWVGAVAYALQIFYDFSGYTDIAIGLGRVFGFRLPENFRYPYAATSIRDFWRRWHITLSDWLRDYLYIPLGGSRMSRPRTYLNIMLVFLVCGLWHGAGWNYLVWGGWHGSWIVLERAFLDRIFSRIPKIFSHVYALLVIVSGWAIFRAESLASAAGYLKSMLFMHRPLVNTYPWGMYLSWYWLVCLAAAAVLSLPQTEMLKQGIARSRLGLILLLPWLVYLLSEVAVGNFVPNIYSNF